MIVLRSTMEAAVQAERDAAHKRLSEIVAHYGRATGMIEGLARQMFGWLSGKADNVTPRQMATLFWEWDDTRQAEFFNALQDVATESRLADPNPSPFGYLGVPAGEAQWYHMVKNLNESGQETLGAMHDHMKHRMASAA